MSNANLSYNELGFFFLCKFLPVVLNLGSFTLLPQHVVRLVLCRDELKADEFTKFQVYIY